MRGFDSNFLVLHIFNSSTKVMEEKIMVRINGICNSSGSQTISVINGQEMV